MLLGCVLDLKIQDFVVLLFVNKYMVLEGNAIDNIFLYKDLVNITISSLTQLTDYLVFNTSNFILSC